MFKGQLIGQLIDNANVKKKEVYEYAGITKSTLDNIIKGNNKPNSSTLEKIADFFQLSIDYFFEREIEIDNSINIGHHVNVNGNGNSVTGDIALSECHNQVAHLKDIIKQKDALLKQKDELLQEKERLIQVLMK